MTEQQSRLKTRAELNALEEEFANDYVMHPASEIFQRPHGAGYWLYGVEFDKELGWLAYEFDETTFDSSDESQFENAVRLWRAKEKLPANYFRLDREFAGNAFAVGCRLRGEGWYEDTDLPEIDEIVQFTLLNELRYG